MKNNTSLPGAPANSFFMAWMTVLLIAVVGLLIVKWMPYYQKALAALSTHSIGMPILMSKDGRVPEASLTAAVNYALAYGKAIWKAMVLGLLLGSAVQALLPRRWIVKAVGKSDVGCLALAGAMSLPSMMCTCCAAPLVAGLRECRVPPGNAVAFWLGNTMLNPATLVFTALVLGWQWLSLRLALGIVMVFGLGWIVNRVANARSATIQRGAEQLPVRDEPSFRIWFETLWRMSVRLIPEYAIIVLLLGASRAWLFPHLGHEVDNSLLFIVTFALAGVIFVIPTAGEVPIVQALLTLGVGVGPAAALLMTLPPISAPSVAMLWRSLGSRTLILVSVGVLVLGCIGGIAAVVLF